MFCSNLNGSRRKLFARRSLLLSCQGCNCRFVDHATGSYKRCVAFAAKHEARGTLRSPLADYAKVLKVRYEVILPI